MHSSIYILITMETITEKNTTDFSGVREHMEGLKG